MSLSRVIVKKNMDECFKNVPRSLKPFKKLVQSTLFVTQVIQFWSNSPKGDNTCNFVNLLVFFKYCLPLQCWPSIHYPCTKQNRDLLNFLGPLTCWYVHPTSCSLVKLIYGTFGNCCSNEWCDASIITISRSDAACNIISSQNRDQ